VLIPKAVHDDIPKGVPSDNSFVMESILITHKMSPTGRDVLEPELLLEAWHLLESIGKIVVKTSTDYYDGKGARNMTLEDMCYRVLGKCLRFSILDYWKDVNR
jgi:phosphoribosylaminoimidazole carboxylase (NCAIR synthetase)